MSRKMAVCEVLQPGQMSYADALDLQNRLVARRGDADAPDYLLLLEHPHSYTLGSSGHDENLLLSERELARRGIEVFRTDRGGDITYHGPGQLVGYPIIQLPRVGDLRADFVGYVRSLEQVLIGALAEYAITAKTIPGLTGVWVDTPSGEAKIAAIGVRITVRAITKHGFALNVNTDLGYFEDIIPCGIRDKGVTSMWHLLGAPVDMAELTHHVIAQFGEVFGLEMVFTEADTAFQRSGLR